MGSLVCNLPWLLSRGHSLTHTHTHTRRAHLASEKKETTHRPPPLSSIAVIITHPPPQLLDSVRADGGRITVRLMNAVVDACRKGRQWEKALEMLEYMRSTGVTPDDFTFTAAIAACRQGGQWDKVSGIGGCAE